MSRRGLSDSDEKIPSLQAGETSQGWSAWSFPSAWQRDGVRPGIGMSFGMSSGMCSPPASSCLRNTEIFQSKLTLPGGWQAARRPTFK